MLGCLPRRKLDIWKDPRLAQREVYALRCRTSAESAGAHRFWALTLCTVRADVQHTRRADVQHTSKGSI